MRYVKLADLTALLEGVKKIRKHSPNTGNGAAFKQGIDALTREEVYELCQGVDAACMAAGRIEHSVVQVEE